MWRAVLHKGTQGPMDSWATHADNLSAAWKHTRQKSTDLRKLSTDLHKCVLAYVPLIHIYIKNVKKKGISEKWEIQKERTHQLFVTRAGVKAPWVRALAMQAWKPEFRSQNPFQRFLLLFAFLFFKAGSRVHTPITSVVLGTETGGLLQLLQV